MDPRNTIRCRVCGQPGPADAKFCARCGARLPTLAPNSPQPGSNGPQEVEEG